MRYFTLLVLTLSGIARPATETRFASGLLRSYNENRITEHLSETDAASRFLVREFGALPADVRWNQIQRIEDATHIHLLYGLEADGIAVWDRFLKLHYNRAGDIDFATSTLETRPKATRGQWRWARARAAIERRLPTGRAVQRISPQKVFWLDEAGRMQKAFDVQIQLRDPFRPSRAVVAGEDGRLLEQRKISRGATANVKIYEKSPFGGSVPVDKTVETEDAGKLQSSELIVRRDQDPDAPTYVDVTPQDFTGGDFATNPILYDPTCVGTTNECENQGFDAVNVYYHLSQYRARVNAYLTTLGADVNFRYDPLNVIINSLHIDLGSDNDGTNETNNALYLGEPCAADGSMDRCILFLRPVTLTGTTATANCGTAPAVFYDLAREAVVVAHEYQHYVTDMISGIRFGSSQEILVGDIMHEGYSDYLGAAYVSDVVGADASLVGEYALQDCSPLQREVGELSVFNSAQVYSSPHRPGLSWATAFWQLRKELGTTKTDLLALKSMFFVSTTPGFFDSVEAVVKADQVLNGGENELRIRRLFYEDVKWTGTLTGAFKDQAHGVFDVGLKGCGAAHSAREGGWGTGLFFGLWLGLTIYGCRRRFSF